MSYTIQHIASIIKASSGQLADAVIEHLLIDSRKIIFPETSLFFALHSNRRDGHAFIKEVYERGVRNFVIDSNFDATNFPQANFFQNFFGFVKIELGMFGKQCAKNIAFSNYDQ